MRRLSAPASVMGECAYAAVSDQLLSGRGRPGRLRGVGVSGAAVVLDPSEIDLAPNQPVSRVSANSCCFLSQALDALAVQRSRSPGFAHGRFKRLTIPTAEVRCGPYVLSRNAMSVVSFTGFPALFLVLSHSPPSLDSRRPECWEINRDLHTSMYSDVKGSVNLISQSLKYSHA